MRTSCFVLLLVAGCGGAECEEDTMVLASAFAGPDAVDCGLAGAEASTCAADAFEQGRPFVVTTGWTGTGDHSWNDSMGFDGNELRVFSQEAEWGCTDVRQVTCATPTVVTGDASVPDEGPTRPFYEPGLPWIRCGGPDAGD